MVRRAGFWAWWKASGRRVAELQARVVLTICYVLVVPPFAVLVRLTSDPLAIKPKSTRGWRDRPAPQGQNPPGARLERARRQY